MHIHWFRPRADWGIDGECRCRMLKRRLFGGFGYAMPGPGFFWDSPAAARKEYEHGK
jgi:hypothetical protein